MNNTKEVNLGKIGKLILSEKVQEYIDCLHDRVGATEWSGVLFYKLISGDIKDIKDLVFKSDFIYPRDIGSATFTSTEASGDLSDAYDIYEDGLECSNGLIHSHHNMNAYFSGTDMQELRENAKIYNYYLSLIVNFDGKYCCKIAIPGKEKYSSVVTLKDSEGNPYQKTIESENDIIFIGDIDVEHKTEKPCEKWLEDKIKELFDKKKQNERKQPVYFGTKEFDGLVKENQYKLFGFQKEAPKKEVTPKEFLMELLATGSIENNVNPDISIEENLKELCEDKEYANVCLDFIDENMLSIYEELFGEPMIPSNFIYYVGMELECYENKFGSKYFYIKLKELLSDILCQ